MEFLVFSDSHGNYIHMKRILDTYASEVDGVIFLGDGAAELCTLRRMFAPLPFYAVLGNNDDMDYLNYGFYREYFLSAHGKSVLLCHGHTHGISGGKEHLASYARVRGAHAVLYGHLHTPWESYVEGNDHPDAPNKDPILLCSPGSIAYPRNKEAPSFGRLHIAENGILFSIGYIK